MASVHATEETDSNLLSCLGERFILVLQWRLVLREMSHPHRVAWSGASQVHHNEKENARHIGFNSLLLI